VLMSEITKISEPRKSSDFLSPKIPDGIFWHPKNEHNQTTSFKMWCASFF